MIPRRETHAGRGCVPIRNTAPDSNPLLGPFLAQLLDESWKSYRKSRRRIRPRGGRRHVHRARISARRLLTTLDLLAGLDGGHGLLEALRALARQFSALGKLRDTQVQLRELNELAISDSERRPLRRSLKKKERRRCRSLTASDVDDIGPQIEKASARLASGPATAASGRRLKSGLNRALRADLERVNTLLPRGPGDLSRMHQARVAIKRYRYLIELLRPILSGVDPGAIKRLRACQARMGQIHDVQLFMERLERWSAKGRLGEGELRELLTQLERRRRVLVSSFVRSTSQPFPRLSPQVAAN